MKAEQSSAFIYLVFELSYLSLTLLYYSLMGEVIEKVEGKPDAEVVTR
ncbi:MAG: hypothetical protein IM570_01600 [Pseudanabaena sp. M179S2SP2A07QC]|jgi:hypothetical protein|nr:hypothetical protein [Pseudanabaena sp. M179S2SP2A07QC]